MEATRTAARTMLKVSIACLTLAALVAIVALLAGDFDETEGKIVLTALATAIYNLTGMAGMSVAGRPDLRAVGFATALVSAIAFVLALGTIWSEWDEGGDDADEFFWKSWGVATVASFSLAQISMTLRSRGDQDGDGIRTLRASTVIAIVTLGFLLSVAILREFDSDGDDVYWRILGVVAVLDILGTLLVPIVRRIQAQGATPVTPGGGQSPAAESPAAESPAAESPAISRALGLDQDALGRIETYVLPAGGIGPGLAAAVEAGARVVVSRTDLAGGGAFALLADPDGRQIALLERPSRSA